MALLQIKSHGTVTTHKVRSIAVARTQMNETVGAAMATGYTRVGSAPDITVLVCDEHKTGMPEGADFCYIVAVSTGKEKR
jgi:hypothetical protein